MSDKSNVIKGQFRPPAPPVSARIEVDVLQEVEHREDGPWLVVYVSGRKVGEVPIDPGTEPDLKRSKVLELGKRRVPESQSSPDLDAEP